MLLKKIFEVIRNFKKYFTTTCYKNAVFDTSKIYEVITS